MRLTRRGAVVVALAVLAVGIAMVWVAALSAARPAVAPTGRAHVTVRAGDTLWSIAGRVAPGTDPRAEIATLRQLNGIGGTQLTPGEQLQVR